MKYIRLEEKNNIAIISIDRPDALNALNSQVLNELIEVFRECENDQKIRVVIITGSGKAFVAGADISGMLEMDSATAEEFSRKGQNVMNTIENSPLIVIAAVNGYALGGGNELALACDLRIASEKARFGQPEVGLGIIAGFGATQRLRRIVGEAKARELLYTGKAITADEAFRIGLVNQLTEGDELLKEAETLARLIVKNGPEAVKKTKKAISRGIDISMKEGLKLEAELFGDCFSTDEQREGMKAFLEKRDANFT